MFKKIYIESDCDDGYLTNGNELNVEEGSIKIINETIKIVLNEDGKIIIPPGNYELLSIQTDCGDFIIDLPNCYFEKVELRSDCGDMTINTNYKKISFDTDMGEYKNLNLKNMGLLNKSPIVKKVVKKVKSVVSNLDLSVKNDKERYY